MAKDANSEGKKEKRCGALAWLLQSVFILLSVACVAYSGYKCKLAVQGKQKLVEKFIAAVPMLMRIVNYAMAAVFGFLLLVWPRMFIESRHWIYYTPVWSFVGMTISEVIMVVKTDRSSWKNYIEPGLFLLLSVASLIMHVVTAVGLYKRSQGKHCACLPWNVSKEDKVECY